LFNFAISRDYILRIVIWSAPLLHILKAGAEPKHGGKRYPNLLLLSPVLGWSRPAGAAPEPVENPCQRPALLHQRPSCQRCPHVGEVRNASNNTDRGSTITKVKLMIDIITHPAYAAVRNSSLHVLDQRTRRFLCGVRVDKQAAPSQRTGLCANVASTRKRRSSKSRYEAAIGAQNDSTTTPPTIHPSLRAFFFSG
jgi:hypothetical protein